MHEMTDKVYYSILIGWIGRLANTVFAQRQANVIFDFKSEVLDQHFTRNKPVETPA